MKKILNLLFAICAFSILTFSYANASSDEPEGAGLGQQDDESVDCIAINGTQTEDTSGQSSGPDDGTRDGEASDR